MCVQPRNADIKLSRAIRPLLVSSNGNGDMDFHTQPSGAQQGPSCPSTNLLSCFEALPKKRQGAQQPARWRHPRGQNPIAQMDCASRCTAHQAPLPPEAELPHLYSIAHATSVRQDMNTAESGLQPAFTVREQYLTPRQPCASADSCTTRA
jgi:hypothetical protein